MKCYIMDDQYGEKLYQDLKQDFHDREFPIKENIKNPLDFIDEIKNDDVILLDNFFPWEYREEPLWALFLHEILTRNINCKIIGISDYGERLLTRFDERENAYKMKKIIGFAPDKSACSVKQFL